MAELIKPIQPIVDAIDKVLLGKQHQVKLAIACLLAKGHLLLEDVPGVGKTTLAHALAQVMGLHYNRVQFTSDLLPADILGTTVFDRESAQFNFHQGPVFTQVLLADEINRATPKTQSALLEAMAEQQVSIEGETRSLPRPFFVIATQNPTHQSGTYALPESQLDRFLMCIALGYPDEKSEIAMYKGFNLNQRVSRLRPLVGVKNLQVLQDSCSKVKASDSLLAYLHRLVSFTREHPDFVCGVSPRGALALLNCSKAWAMMHGRDHVLPEDIQLLMPAIIGHRVHAVGSSGYSDGLQLVNKALKEVPVL